MLFGFCVLGVSAGVAGVGWWRWVSLGLLGRCCRLVPRGCCRLVLRGSLVSLVPLGSLVPRGLTESTPRPLVPLVVAADYGLAGASGLAAPRGLTKSSATSK